MWFEKLVDNSERDYETMVALLDTFAQDFEISNISKSQNI